MTLPTFDGLKLTFAMTFAALGTTGAIANILVDDFASGPYDYDSSPYKAFYNGFTHSRFYFQNGATVLGTHRMVLVAGAATYPTNADFDGTINSGLARAQAYGGYVPYWEYDYGVEELLGNPFPWKFANMHANLNGHEVVRLHFARASGNIRFQVSFNSSARYYHDSGWFNAPDSECPFVIDVPTSIWTSAELADVNQMVYGFLGDAGATCDLLKIELTNVVPEPATALAMGPPALWLLRRRRFTASGQSTRRRGGSRR